MFPSLFKVSALCALTAAVSVGCTTMDHHNSAKQQTVTVHAVSPEGVGSKIGTVTFHDSPQGLIVMTNLSSLPSGQHGFHIHERGSCEPAMKDGKMTAAQAAGGHFNPTGTGHGTPTTGHLGDLPALTVDSNGKANQTLLAPRLTLNQIQGLSVMVHAGGDNYSDHPKPLGGGGERIACGVIK
ncbi:superoxide dismutase [Cu-Zn] SodC [Acinetobacter radioresistens]|uniref:superoxide dismutase [Cu-Zn] SodC n=1 Tax=Acinetobacter radioresistens TaxID=40216 RepID=UPI002247C1F2|nr:superoxide dismutase [Cu-Zn] SodC [Acinetobacter radioresistens]MCX0339048.1 superoxide dismutase [Cu-Zn] SodC [Acinetobacter radioresistens]